MKIKTLLVTTMLSFMATLSVNAQQPYGGCWHPKDITNWSPETDPDAKFNRSKVPLATRFKEPQLMKANANQFYEGQICDATILFPICSSCPSQGANNFLGYQPTYWQYMDKLVYWAGSASEGIIIPPPAGSTDAAHQSGVKSLGQIFFPPSYYGGKQEWVREMLTRVDGVYIYAVKLYEIAKYMGFDGWFINEETGGGSTSEWIEFIKDFNKIADANGDSQMEIQWYNASGYPNVGILKSHKNTSQFLEYGSPGDYRGYADQIGCTQAETFSKIYGGVQVVNSGHTGYKYYLDKAMPTTGHVGSLDLFCPEERIWKDNVKMLLGTQNDNGAVAYDAIAKTFSNEEQMWVNRKGDPSADMGGEWPGLSGRVLERSVINSMPFVSSFCVGVGKHRFVEGAKKGTQDWYHSGVQSIMPTWRWWIENKGELSVSIDWDDAYNFGSSIKIAGKLSAGDHLTRLYKTMIQINDGGTLRLVYKSNHPETLEVKLGTESKVDGEMVTLSALKTSENNGWTVAEYDLSSLNGKTVYMIALNLKASTELPDYELSLGELAMLPAGYAPATVAVTNLETKSVLGDEKGDIRMTWNYDYTEDFDHFDIYTVTADGNRKLVGQTRGEGFYIPTFYRNGNDAYINVELVPVMKDMKQQAPQTLKVDFPAPKKPEVSFKLSKSYIMVGETVVLTAKATGNPTAWKWVLPETLELVSGELTDAQITVKGLVAGKQEVTVEATNIIGTSSTTKEVLDVLNEGEMNEVHNVVLHKTVVDYSGSTNYQEVPSKIIDGVTKPYSVSDKWCNVSPDNWVIFDLEGAYRIYGFRIYDANSGPESGCDQIRSYTIELSDDGENWVTVVEEDDRENESIKTDYIAPAKARYVRLTPHVSGTLRIWEFEVYGRDINNMTIKVNPEQLNLNAGEKTNITLKYALNGDPRDATFTCKATSATGNVEIEEITEDVANSTFTIPVKAIKKLGHDKVTLRLNNGHAYKEFIVPVIVNSNDRPNVLNGAKATLRHYKADYSFEAQYDEFTTGTLTDGNKTAEGCEAIESPSTHKKDFWAIFTAPDDNKWNLSKVKVYIPNKNQGVNDNDKEGAVNSEISIMMGDDLTHLAEIKTFTDLNEVSELEYILPEHKNCKYLAIVCTLNPYFYPSLAEVEAYEQFKEAFPVMNPVVINGWNADIIAEAKPAAEHTNLALDSQGWVLYTTAVQEGGAIVGDDGMINTKKGTPFKLADYKANNALVMNQAYDDYVVTFDKPTNCEEVYLLMISSNGTSTVYAKVKYADDTTGEEQSLNPADWYSDFESGDEAVYGFSRIIRNTVDTYQADEIDNRFHFRMYEYALPTDINKKVTSLTLSSYSYGARPTLIAVSMKGRYVSDETDGINATVNGSTERTIQGIYSVNGIKLDAPQNGINIIRFTDGTMRKILIRK